MIKRYLMAPGPTPVPPEVLAELAQPVIHHRTAEFSNIVAEVEEGLRALFQTRSDVIFLASSGTGAMEAAVTNTLSPGDEVVVVNGGKFGERWAKICAAFGVAVHEVAVEWGRAVDPAAVEAVLDAHRRARALLFQASETSTTVLHPVEPLVAAARERGVLSIVDGITAVGVCDIPMDRWGIDVLVTGSQKALMLPPGLACIALSDRAWKASAEARLPRFYFDLQAERKNLAKRTTAYTPAISLVCGLRVALRMILAEGLSAVFARHDRLARATRAALQALGLELLAPSAPSPAATGCWLPAGLDGTAFVRYLREELGITVAGGQDKLKGKVVRIAHLGYCDSLDVVAALGALEMALERFGVTVERGRGVAAAEAVLGEALAAPS